MENFSLDSLLDLIKSKHGLPSDYKLALYLGIVYGSVQNYRHGRSFPDERVCQILAQAAGIDADVLTAQVQAARCRNAETKSVWERIAVRLQSAAVTASVSVMFFFSPMAQDPHGALAGEVSNLSNLNSAVYTSYQLRVVLTTLALAWILSKLPQF